MRAPRIVFAVATVACFGTACQLFLSTEDTVAPRADGSAEAGVAADAGTEDAVVADALQDAGAPDVYDAGRGVCEGHDLCWTFDDDHRTAQGGVTIKPTGGYQGSPYLLMSMAGKNGVIGMSAKNLPPPTTHLHLECLVKVDAVADPDDSGVYPPEATVCSATDADGFGVAVYVGHALAGPQRTLRITTTDRLADASVVKLCEDSASFSLLRSTFIPTSVDVVWSGAQVTVTSTIDNNGPRTCPAVEGAKLPMELTAAAGIFDPVHATTSSLWAIGIDNFILDVK